MVNTKMKVSLTLLLLLAAACLLVDARKHKLDIKVGVSVVDVGGGVWVVVREQLSGLSDCDF